MPVCIKWRRRKINPFLVEFLSKVANGVFEIARTTVRSIFRLAHGYVPPKSNTFGAFHLSLSFRESRREICITPRSTTLLSLPLFVLTRVPRSHATAVRVRECVCVCVCVRAFEFRRSLAYPGFLRPCSLATSPGGSLFFGDVREVRRALVNVFMGLWDN